MGGSDSSPSPSSSTPYSSDDNAYCCFSNGASSKSGASCSTTYDKYNQNACISPTSTYCNSNFNDNVTNCKTSANYWGRSLGSTSYDTGITNYCNSSAGQSDNSCKCLNNYTTLYDQEPTVDPICYYNYCRSEYDPLLTGSLADMYASQGSMCPDVCNISISNLEVYDNIGSSISISATCNGETESLEYDTLWANFMDLSYLGSFNLSIENYLKMNWIFISIVVATILLIILIAIVFKNNDN